ncbi:LLM class flavin-dependent oxidoreductase [Sediminitomix flava]|uniref:Luciferase-like monooxygenase n=1 Tax=Sediminitomix flava TaxID=379075 RepID=A0A315ZBW0_SEDFL|nr:LLM class flavin-dependent oxidoreductase [Sediminitomix flava]PWJ42850.1 luciferase family oxidoreductase group 1 [Sediminitomix flava]
MSKKIKLSILDQSPIASHESAADALSNSTALIKAAEKWGYHRYWVSEHHNSTSLAGSAPEVLIAHLAANTHNIRVGSGGVMLPHYSSYKVAEAFNLLATLYPNRIDLGVGRAPGTDAPAIYALNAHKGNYDTDKFPQQINELKQYTRSSIQSEVGTLSASPLPKIAPPIWTLSSSGFGARHAAQQGVGFAFAHFINPNGGAEAMKYYKEAFVPQTENDTPNGLACVFVHCADTNEKALELQHTMDILMLYIETGRRIPIASYEELKDVELSPAEQGRILQNRERMIFGTPEKVKSELEQLAENYDVDEIMAVTITHDFKNRLRSYELLAEAFELN